MANTSRKSSRKKRKSAGNSPRGPSTERQRADNVSALRGVSQLTFDAVEQVTDIVEAMHLNIASTPLPFSAPIEGRTTGITGLVYSNIRLINGWIRGGVDLIFRQLTPGIGEVNASGRREAVLAALNGVMGDYLAASENPLAITMSWRRNGRTLDLGNDALPNASGKLLVAVHGLCMNDLQWTRNGHNHAEALASDNGFTPVYLHYNSGRHISTNGREFADQLEALVRHWPVPVEELTILAHSMGGLLARSAYSYGTEAGHDWPEHLRRIVFLGTPHHGAPLERGGNWLQTAVGISPYSAPLARLGMIRSAGVTDLRHGNLRDEDWQDHDRFARHDDTRMILPLPEGVECYAVAASTGQRANDLNDRLLGDGLVKTASALGQHDDPDRQLAFKAAHQLTLYGTNHWDLLDRQEIYHQLQRWLS